MWPVFTRSALLLHQFVTYRCGKSSRYGSGGTASPTFPRPARRAAERPRAPRRPPKRYDYFDSDDPVEAAKFVVSEAVAALWGSVLRHDGVAAFTGCAPEQLIRWEAGYSSPSACRRCPAAKRIWTSPFRSALSCRPVPARERPSAPRQPDLADDLIMPGLPGHCALTRSVQVRAGAQGWGRAGLASCTSWRASCGNHTPAAGSPSPQSGSNKAWADGVVGQLGWV
jgi:hypothetical protein